MTAVDDVVDAGAVRAHDRHGVLPQAGQIVVRHPIQAERTGAPVAVDELGDVAEGLGQAPLAECTGGEYLEQAIGRVHEAQPVVAVEQRLRADPRRAGGFAGDQHILCGDAETAGLVTRRKAHGSRLGESVATGNNEPAVWRLAARSPCRYDSTLP